MQTFLFLMLVTLAPLQDFKAYLNYDFVPGDKVVFEDDFRTDQDGEFPAHWKLVAGQGVVNKFQGAPAFLLTEGNYAKVQPRVKGDAYLGDPFTLEYDFFAKPDGFGKMVVYINPDGENER